MNPTTHAVSPPTTLTLLYNPLMGFLSSAYSAQVSPTVAVSTRFGVNVYSYESDLTIGGEWWIGRGRGKRGLELPSVAVAKEDSEIEPASRVSLRPVTEEAPEKTALVATAQAPQSAEDRDGVLKARIAGDWVSMQPHCSESLTCSHSLSSTNRGFGTVSSPSGSCPTCSAEHNPSDPSA